MRGRSRILGNLTRAALPLFVFAAACAEGRGGEDGFTVRDSAGITMVDNHYRQPVWASNEDAWRLSETPPIQIGNIEGDFAQQLFHAYHSRRLPDGSFVVAVSGLGQVRTFDAQGNYVETWNRVGDGPGEFGAPWRLYPLAGDSTLVVDSDHDGGVFDKDANFRRAIQFQAPGDGIDGPCDPIGQFADGTLVYRAAYPIDSTGSGVMRTRVRLVHYGLDGSPLGAIGDFDHETKLLGAEGTYVFGPTGRFAVSDSTIWYGAGERLEFREITRDGRILRIIHLERPSQEVTGPDVFAYKQAVTNSERDTPAAATTERRLAASVFADTFPAHAELFVDEQRNLWVQSWRWYDVGAPLVWYVFDPAGRFLGEVPMLSRYEPHQIGDDFVLGRIANDAGQEGIYLYRLIKPARAN